MSRSTSRGREARTVFDPRLPSSSYTSENLTSFVQAAGPQYVRRLDELLDAERKRLKQRNASPTEVREALRQVRYDYVSFLDMEGLVPALARGGKVEKTKTITEKEVETIYNDGLGIADLFELITSHNAADFNTNALARAASLLRVSGVTNATKGLKDTAKKEAYRELILSNRNKILSLATVRAQEAQAREGLLTENDLKNLSEDELDIELEDMGLATGGSRQDKIKRILASQPQPAMGVQYTRSALESMRIPELKDILGNLKQPKTGKKSELIDRILRYQGSATQVPVSDLIASMIEEALAGHAPEMREKVREMPADAFDSATVPDLKRLARALDINIKGLTRKAQIIEALTNKMPSRELVAQRSSEIRRTLFECLEASDEELQAEADKLGVRWRGRDKESICNDIYENYLSKFTNLFLNEVGAGRIDLNEIARMPDKTRRAEIARIARRANFENVETMQDLLRAFLLSHYRVRALRFAPHILGLVTRYIDRGEIPNDAQDLEDMARVFSDLNPDLISEEPAAIQQSLDVFYKSLVSVIMNGNEGNIQAILSRIHQFGYHAPTRRGGRGSREVFAREVIRTPNRQPIIEEVHEFTYPGEADEILPGVMIREAPNGDIQVRQSPRRALEEEVQAGRLSPREAQAIADELEIPEFTEEEAGTQL